jgi:hypothetical protein
MIIKYVVQKDDKYKEIVKTQTRISPKEQLDANVVLDFKLRKVKKLRIEKDKPLPKVWDHVYAFYKETYPEIVKAMDKINGY